MNVAPHDESQNVSSYYRPRKELVKMTAIAAIAAPQHPGRYRTNGGQSSARARNGSIA